MIRGIFLPLTGLPSSDIISRMTAIDVTITYPQTFEIAPASISGAVSAAFYAQLNREGLVLKPRMKEKAEAVRQKVFNAAVLTGRCLAVPGEASLTVALIIFVKGLKELEKTASRLSDHYYMELWGSALISEGIHAARSRVKESALAHHMAVTEERIPGVGSVPLETQKEIFRLLRPEDLGITLLDNDLMSPEKAFSCLITLTPKV